MPTKSGNPKRYKNLLGVTLGTGFGGGIVRHGELFVGDTVCAGEVWLLRNKLQPETNIEEGACIRAVRRVYAVKTGIPFEESPQPKDIFEIATGKASGNPSAAQEAFRQLGEVVGDGIAQALTMIDGLAVIGGGLSGAGTFFLPAIVQELSFFSFVIGCPEKSATYELSLPLTVVFSCINHCKHIIHRGACLTCCPTA